MKKPIGYGLCFVCDAPLVGPICPKCYPRTAPFWKWLVMFAFTRLGEMFGLSAAQASKICNAREQN